MTNSYTLTENKWKVYSRKIVNDWRLYALLLPMVIFFVVWKYLPIFGTLIAFKEYDATQGVFGSDFNGFYHFRNLMFGPQSVAFWQAFRNTFILSLYGLIFGFPFPIILALFFSEIKSDAYRSLTQIMVYLPKFISTVVITTIMALLLKAPANGQSAGILAKLLYQLGIGTGSTDSILIQPQYFRAIYHVSGIWETAGYGSIVYFAAIVGISPTNYEAARVDGATKLEQIRYVTLPGISSTLTIMLIMRMGSMFSIGFEKVLLMYNPANYVTADVISTFVYRLGMDSAGGKQIEVAAAADFFNAIIAMVMVLGANFISSKVSDTALF